MNIVLPPLFEITLQHKEIDARLRLLAFEHFGHQMCICELSNGNFVYFYEIQVLIGLKSK